MCSAQMLMCACVCGCEAAKEKGIISVHVGKRAVFISCCLSAYLFLSEK